MPTKSHAEFRPMLAATCDDLSTLRLPMLGSAKLNGIRCIVHPKLGPITRNLKPIRNDHVFMMLTGMPFFDGELIVGPMTADNVWNATASGVMRKEGRPKFEFHVFDILPLHPDEPYEERYARMMKQANTSWVANLNIIRAVTHKPLTNLKEVQKFEKAMVSVGFEGIMLRDPRGLYKGGRSSPKEGWLFKHKRMHDAEATICGFKEKLHNANEAKTNAVGYTERSSHKANKQPMGTLGALIVRAEFDHKGNNGGSFFTKNEVTFDIGTGFDDALRAHIWRNRAKFMGKQVTFKYQTLSAEKGLPIFPVFVGFRQDL